ncbi:MAG: alpha/beta fold hydrolase [Cyanobacteria bacterium HKST-UBA02]|nr:alpha/beta fold hydrolase [Cyanobacteria bacterium HKST-UBA02]
MAVLVALSTAAQALPSLAGESAPCLSWKNPLVSRPSACVLCIHGLGLHSRSFEHFGKELARRRLAVFAIDVRGFGSWMKNPGEEKVDFDACLEDVRQAIQSIKKAYPGIPVFLLGESMGGAIALRAASLYPQEIAGLISSVPSEERFRQGRTDLKVALHFLSGPKKDFDIGSQIVEQATDNENLKRQWREDPLSRLEISPKELLQFQNFMNDNHDSAEKIENMPVLFVQGTDDELVKPDGTWELFNRLTTKDKVFVALPSEHLIFEEAQCQDPEKLKQSIKLLSAWLSSKVVEAWQENGIAGGGAASGPRQHPLSPPASNPAGLEQARNLMRQGRLREARQELRSMNKVQANQALLNMPRRPGRHRARQPGQAGSPELAVLCGGRPTVVAFYADWCEQSRGMDESLDRIEKTFRGRIKVMRVDIEKDSGSNKSLVDLLDVGPIPTVVFMTAEGQVVSTVIGDTGYVNYLKGAYQIAGGPGRH